MIKKLLFAICAVSFAASAQNNYLDFDGFNDNVSVPNSANLVANATAISMSCKVYPKRVTSGFPDFNGILGYRNESNFDFYLIQLSSTDVEARFRNSAGQAYTITYTGLALNQWTQFFLVFNGSTLKLYAGNSEVGSVSAFGTAPASNADAIKIGLITFEDFNWYHSGYIDEVSLWNKALTPTDIGAITANNGEIAAPSSEANLKMYYKFNQGIPYGNNTGQVILNDALGITNGTLDNFALTGSTSNWGAQDLGMANFSQHAVALYPNPATDHIRVSGLAYASDIQILDITGRIIFTKKILPEASVDISSLKSGMYFLLVNRNRKIRFIKN